MPYNRLMPTTITVRLEESRREYYERRAQSEGVRLSEWVRRALEAYQGPVVPVDRSDEFESRLARLEEMAGL